MQVGGEIRRYELEDWWLKTFSEEQRDLIAEVYRPLGFAGKPLVEGATRRQPELSTADFLANLAKWLNSKKYGDVAVKVADKAAEVMDMPGNAWRAHFMFQAFCEVYYRFRDEVPGCLEKAVWACEQDIALSEQLGSPEIQPGITVSHHCFNQLAIIEEKRGNYGRAIQLCHMASAQGWRGDWDKRISKLERRRDRGRP